MTCQEMVEFLMDFLDDALPAEQSRDFQRHLEICPPCVAYLESYRETIAVGRQVCSGPGAPVPADVPEDLVAAILTATGKA